MFSIPIQIMINIWIDINIYEQFQESKKKKKYKQKWKKAPQISINLMDQKFIQYYINNIIYYNIILQYSISSYLFIMFYHLFIIKLNSTQLTIHILPISSLQYLLQYLYNMSKIPYLIFIIALIITYIRDSDHNLRKNTHQNNSNSLNEISPNYINKVEPVIGWTQQALTQSYRSSNILDIITYKKWDSYVFVSFNYYIVQITLIQLRYASQILITASTFKDSQQMIGEYFVDLELSQQFYQNEINVTTSNLKFLLQRSNNESHYNTNIKFQTNIQNKNLTGDFSQFMERNNCIYMLRPHTNLKCFPSASAGYLSMKYTKFIKQYNQYVQSTDLWMFSKKIGISLFDGFRGSGYTMYWVWGMGIGWNENIQVGAARKQEIAIVGINIGLFQNYEQDFISIDGEEIKLEGVQYEFNQNFKDQQIVIRSKNPKGKFIFDIKSHHKYLNDYIVVKKEMHKAYGVWKGHIQYKGKTFNFEKVFGLLEVVKSKF